MQIVSEKCSSLNSFESTLPRERKSLLYIHSLVHRIAYICFKCTFGANPRELINFTLCREEYFAKFSVYFLSLISILYSNTQKRICLSHIACLDRYDGARILYFPLTHAIKCGTWTCMRRAKWIVHDSTGFRSSVQIANYNRSRIINYLRWSNESVLASYVIMLRIFSTV